MTFLLCHRRGCFVYGRWSFGLCFLKHRRHRWWCCDLYCSASRNTDVVRGQLLRGGVGRPHRLHGGPSCGGLAGSRACFAMVVTVTALSSAVAPAPPPPGATCRTSPQAHRSPAAGTSPQTARPRWRGRRWTCRFPAHAQVLNEQEPLGRRHLRAAFPSASASKSPPVRRTPGQLGEIPGAPSARSGAGSRPAGDRTGHRSRCWALSRVNVLDVGEGGRPALLLEDAEGDAGLDCPLAQPPKVVGDGENVVQVNGGRRGRHGAAPFTCPQSFPFGTGLGRLPSVSVSGRSFAGGLWDAFSAYLSQQSDRGVLARGRIGAFSAFTPFAPLPPLWAARVSPRAAGCGRPLRRADLAHSRVRGRRR